MSGPRTWQEGRVRRRHTQKFEYLERIFNKIKLTFYLHMYKLYCIIRLLWAVAVSVTNGELAGVGEHLSPVDVVTEGAEQGEEGGGAGDGSEAGGPPPVRHHRPAPVQREGVAAVVL